ncbi:MULTISPECIES: orotidine 5'-phosphate decarboxylase / HUMPS family protein [Lactiplantibacillus]|uniref:orotidine 5'-phosphate decarboxylase / HUMPS family protein n=1 Tax=Lactiplantibacillus TaxID=2767842 RepID=UPI0023AB43ED|nr:MULTISPECIES: orotidine 5'-phosphate decarboxylase / HUMPS family protein [Lactiplantibacillus]MDV0431169.1 orotidine 5'-phosphate decarboxylase / HUMPS family protein [Lactiplantibacillus sp. DA1]WEE35953.1 orotidine 5'-phosphate decarboxylase [Lactiplantibacillus paraplantarum]
MKLQAAIDRVTLDSALTLAKQLDPVVDVLEFGTSLVKDYGLIELQKTAINLQHAQLLLDLKTNDEGMYEFTQGFKTEADILTAMAASSRATLEQVYGETMRQKKQILIDLLEVDDQRIAQLTDLKHAIFGLHHSKDSGAGFDAVGTVARFHERFPQVKHIAVAGGIDIDQAKALSHQGIAEVIIVGGKISGANDPLMAAKKFMEAIQ